MTKNIAAGRPALPNASARMIDDLLRTLRYIAEHEPSGPEALDALQIGQATLIRHLNAARKVLQMEIKSVRRKHLPPHYVITDFGILDSDRFISTTS